VSAELVDSAIWLFLPVVFFLTLAGLGTVALLPLRLAPVPWSWAVISGLTAIMATVPFINVFVPLGVHTGAVTVGLGTAGLLWGLRKRLLDASTFVTAVFAVLLSTILYRASAFVIPIRFFTDSIAYHLSVMEWTARSPMPIGNAIIHARAGSNPGSLTLMSAFRWDPLGQTHLFAMEITLRALLVVAVIEIIRLNGFRSRPGALSLGVLVAALPFFVINKMGTDGGIGFLVLVAAILALQANEPTLGRLTRGLTAVLLASVAVITTFKLSAATVALLLVPLVRRHSLSTVVRDLIRREHRPLLFLALLTVLGWLMRGFAASGCVLYPLPQSCFDVPWGVGPDSAVLVTSVVTDFARQTALTGTSASLLDFSWVQGWFPVYLTSVPAMLLLAAVPVGVIGASRSAEAPKKRMSLQAVAVVSALPIIFAALSLAGIVRSDGPLSVDLGIVAVLADYPRLWLLKTIPLAAVIVLLAAAILAPRASQGLTNPSDPQDRRLLSGAVSAWSIFVVLSLLYWFVAAPAVRFAWPFHVLIAGPLLAVWIRTVRLPRPREHAELRTRGERIATAAFLSGCVVAVGIIGALDPVAPLTVERIEPAGVTVLEPSGLIIFTPAGIDDCWNLYPCAPTSPTAAEAKRVLGRTVFRRSGDIGPAFRIELGIS